MEYLEYRTGIEPIYLDMGSNRKEVTCEDVVRFRKKVFLNCGGESRKQMENTWKIQVVSVLSVRVDSP